jgi:hypothetical protein
MLKEICEPDEIETQKKQSCGTHVPGADARRLSACEIMNFGEHRRAGLIWMLLHLPNGSMSKWLTDG